MTDLLDPAPTATTAGHDTPTIALRERPGRWLDGYDPEDDRQWTEQGRAIAGTNLRWSILAEFLGFAVWQLWATTVVVLPRAGFHFTDSQVFWLISMPSLVGATLRIPYTFTVGRFGGRTWTTISALLLLVPTLGLAAVLSTPASPFWLVLLVSATAGLGGGNFASSMANITWFYPAREKGWALGLNAAGGNLGAAVSQLVVPIAVSLGAAGSLHLARAGLVWVPFILLAAWGAHRFMHNLSHARGDVVGSLATLHEPHFWVLALLYVGTFGSFIGFSGVFPKLIKDLFPHWSSIHLLVASVSLSFLGPLVGSLARPYGGRLADRFGGARITVASFAAMAALALCVVLTTGGGGFGLFLGLFLLLFVSSGVGNGATYRMIPVVYRLRGDRVSDDGTVLGWQRLSAAALGLVAAIGAYGGFLVPQVLSASKSATGGYDAAFYGFVAFYLVGIVLTWACYLRGGHEERI